MALAANTLRALLAHAATFIRACYSHARTVPKPVGMAINTMALAANTLEHCSLMQLHSYALATHMLAQCQSQ